MQRGVGQLLFHYLPGRTVDWENGLAIVQLDGARLSSAWGMDRAGALLEEIGYWLDQWRQSGGEVDSMFPDPRREASRFVVGEPEAIHAQYFESALHCTNCSRLVFRKRADLARDGFRCHHCNRPTLRQFGQVLVHGCGELMPIREFIPSMKKGENGVYVPTFRPLRCPQCGKTDALAIPARSERVRDMTIKCQRCEIAVVDRITGRCHRCLRRDQVQSAAADESDSARESSTIVTRVAMRMTRYSASEAYYPQSLTILHLGSPAAVVQVDTELATLRRLLPAHRRPTTDASVGASVEELGRQLKEAETLGDRGRMASLQARLMGLLQSGTIVETTPDEESLADVIHAPDLAQAVEQSIAFRTTVTTTPTLALAAEGGGTSNLLIEEIKSAQERMGIRELLLVDDLPVISATFGYTRRAFTPTYEELSVAGLPVTVRPFHSLDRSAARALGQAGFAGAVPILAREGKHEGLFISLDPVRVVRWVEANGVRLPHSNQEPIVRLLGSLEPVDRYYDGIWQHSARRLVFGLTHTLSHALMRVASRLAGLERTSVSEYVLLPLLGTVVFDNSSAIKLGGMELTARDHLLSLLDMLQLEAMECVFDVSCIDHTGACPGCIHSPEIACRVFNHGLSRAFLIGGHAPWADVASEERIVGYWDFA
jgi:hypothetical protein